VYGGRKRKGRKRGEKGKRKGRKKGETDHSTVILDLYVQQQAYYSYILHVNLCDLHMWLFSHTIWAQVISEACISLPFLTFLTESPAKITFLQYLFIFFDSADASTTQMEFPVVWMCFAMTTIFTRGCYTKDEASLLPPREPQQGQQEQQQLLNQGDDSDSMYDKLSCQQAHRLQLMCM